MCALAGIDPIVGQSGFNNDTGRRNVRPLHRNAEPRITASPTPRTHKHIMLPFVKETAVQFLDIVCNQLVVGCRIPLRLHINHILNVFHYTMSQRILALQQQP